MKTKIFIAVFLSTLGLQPLALLHATTTIDATNR